MTPFEIKEARRKLGLTQRELGLVLRLKPSSADRTVRRWEDGQIEVSGPASVAIEAMLAGYRPRQWPSKEIEDIALICARRGEPTLSLDDAIAILKGELHPLIAWRKAGGLSQGQLAAKAGVPAETVSDIERGVAAEVAAATLKKLADVLGVNVDDLTTD